MPVYICPACFALSLCHYLSCQICCVRLYLSCQLCPFTVSTCPASFALWLFLPVLSTFSCPCLYLSCQLCPVVSCPSSFALPLSLSVLLAFPRLTVLSDLQVCLAPRGYLYLTCHFALNMFLPVAPDFLCRCQYLSCQLCNVRIYLSCQICPVLYLPLFPALPCS